MRPLPWLAALAATLALAAPAAARVIPISVTSRVSIPRTETGDGLRMRFKDQNTGCGIAYCQASTDTVTQLVTTMPNLNYLLNQGATIGPFSFGSGYFETRWDAWINITAAGDYVFSEQVDDGGVVTIADSVIVLVDGANWFVNAVSDTVRFEAPGLYPFRAYLYDCQPCCRGFRFGGMGPAGSGMMAWTPGFDFNSDLGPCCTYGSNGPGVSVVPGALFFTTVPTSGVADGPVPGAAGAIVQAWSAPNPARGALLVSAELARPGRVWAEIYDASGRRVATLADGESRAAGTARWPWAGGALGGGNAYFYRVRAEDGSSASGRITVVR